MVRTFSFTLYSGTRTRVANVVENVTGENPLVVASTPGRNPTIGTAVCFGISGAISGGAVSAFACKRKVMSIGKTICINHEQAHSNSRSLTLSSVVSWHWRQPMEKSHLQRV